MALRVDSQSKFPKTNGRLEPYRMKRTRVINTRPHVMILSFFVNGPRVFRPCSLTVGLPEIGAFRKYRTRNSTAQMENPAITAAYYYE